MATPSPGPIKVEPISPYVLARTLLRVETFAASMTSLAKSHGSEPALVLDELKKKRIDRPSCPIETQHIGALVLPLVKSLKNAETKGTERKLVSPHQLQLALQSVHQALDEGYVEVAAAGLKVVAQFVKWNIEASKSVSVCQQEFLSLRYSLLTHPKLEFNQFLRFGKHYNLWTLEYKPDELRLALALAWKGVAEGDIYERVSRVYELRDLGLDTEGEQLVPNLVVKLLHKTLKSPHDFDKTMRLVTDYQFPRLLNTSPELKGLLEKLIVYPDSGKALLHLSRIAAAFPGIANTDEMAETVWHHRKQLLIRHNPLDSNYTSLVQDIVDDIVLPRVTEAQCDDLGRTLKGNDGLERAIKIITIHKSLLKLPPNELDKDPWPRMYEARLKLINYLPTDPEAAINALQKASWGLHRFNAVEIEALLRKASLDQYAPHSPVRTWILRYVSAQSDAEESAIQSSALGSQRVWGTAVFNACEKIFADCEGTSVTHQISGNLWLLQIQRSVDPSHSKFQNYDDATRLSDEPANSKADDDD